MKRMSEVFELPLAVEENQGEPLLSDAPCYFESFDEDGKGSERAKHAAHAINHVDALADALAAIVMNAEDAAFESWLDSNHLSGDFSEVQYKFEQSFEFKKFMDEFGEAQAALKAYRGEA